MKKNWNNLTMLVVVICVISASTVLAVPTVTFNSMGLKGYYSSFPVGTVYAGEMKFTAAGFDSASGVTNGQFISFCIEADEHVYFGHTYDAIINDAAWSGGIGGGNPDPLGNATAWLYNNYLDNVMGSSSSTIAKDYQTAIWYLEEEISSLSNLSANAQSLVTLAQTHSDWNNTTIKVLNLWPLGMSPADPGNIAEGTLYVQDCLVRIETPIVPTPGAMLLASLGMGLVGWLRKRNSL